MTDRKIDLITQAVTACAESAQRTVNEFALEIWVESLLALDDLQFHKAMALIRQCIKEQRLPKITEVEAFAQGQLSGDDQAQQVADLIASAVSRFGRPNGSEASRFMGDMAWATVQRLGGWEQVCSVESYRDLAVAKAQWKHTAKTVQKAAAGGFLNGTPSLPKPLAIPNGLRPASEILKLVPSLGGE